MNRLATRLVLSHLLVVVLGAVVTLLVVRQLAPLLFDDGLHRMGPAGGGMGAGQALREQFATAVDRSLVIGALVGALAAALAGVVAAYRIVRPVNGLREAARALASGRYAAPLPTPRDRELAELAADLGSLGTSLADTETRRLALLGEVAHEMRTPLTVIDGYVEGMIDGVLPTTPVELGQVSVEVRRLRRLAEDLSALSRADEGRLTLAPTAVDLRDVVGSAAERLRGQVEEAGVRLVVEGGAAPLPVRVDADRIAQVVTNLIGNAVRATPAGGEVEVRCAATESTATAMVADTGEGLAAEDLERVFERFYRVPGRRTGEQESGHGIGLTIARSIARAHGGELSATSAGRGSGAKFTLSLPLRQGD
ncbi:MAG TPA: HAMP domain-containing sensor histidine kinase [Dermatophilaceae bacterium]|nr:HAMP domain-containing sensor histidine kinase [Dermatophilaceae bacterium]